MLLITGANGTLGRLVVKEVLRRAPDAPLAVSVRDATAAADLAERGVDVRQADGARIAPVLRSDLAPAIVAVLTEDGHQGKTYDLTGQDAVSWAPGRPTAGDRDDLAVLGKMGHRAPARSRSARALFLSREAALS